MPQDAAPLPSESPLANPRDLAPFASVDTWIFDLDNTLYPPHTDLFAQVDQKMSEFVAQLLDMEREAARALQKDYYKRYGTTLRGLMVEHGINPDGFLEFVHDIDHSKIEANPRLSAAIEALPGRRFIMTNGTTAHALAIAQRLGVHGHFEDIFDIVAADLIPKPHADTYNRFWDKHGIDPTRAAMFEDLSRNLAVPHARGMRTVLVVPEGTREVFRESWEMEGQNAPHVEYVTDDLTGFLERVSPVAQKVSN
ncbi:pyrimidine 5'-nucleotidase [Acuticoccus sediminis]|uniref:Pyrimidine 5'-nucleotidase n=1 Tax=Acuticoccus sediminis TaxID=2184697 RepID=A0A8B2P2C3_9HYPH|nr:pyrimidine 5'-nucleotidase [Acuticoccus sediminis]RAI04094.1 pyrimidine 5'-nucleotidase [Acuticoccus sediminis]